MENSVQVGGQVSSAEVVKEREKLHEGSWLVFEINAKKFALRAEHSREMFNLGQVHAVAGHPSYMRGVTVIRDVSFNVLDLRLFLGYDSLPEEYLELAETLKQRRKEHEGWIAELEASIVEDREFKLATDPHKCAFGKWYDNFTTSDNMLSRILERFDAPHKLIHGVAVKVRKAFDEEGHDAAIALIEETRNRELKLMLTLFEEVNALLQKPEREIGIVVQVGDTKGVIVVDHLVTAREFEEDQISELDEGVSSEFFTNIAHVSEDERMILLLDTTALIKAFETVPAKADD